jgi:hypothetical protein
MAHRSRAAARAGTARRRVNSGCDEKIALAALAGVTLLIGGVETANAGTVTETQSFTIGPTSGSSTDVLSFDMFDPSLGTLTGVSFILTSDTTTSVTIDVPAREAPTLGGSATNAASFSVVVENPNLTLFETTNTASASCTTSFASCTNTESNGPVAFGGTAAVPAADVAEFVGSGSIVVDLDYVNSPLVTSCTNSICSATGFLTWNDAPGTLEVEYQVAVPEPSSLVLFGSGLLSFIGLSRGRRRKVSLDAAHRTCVV